MALRHILIRSIGKTMAGDVMAFTATELAEHYTAGEIARLQIGLAVERPDALHVDLVATHDRHATPDLRGSVLLRRLARHVTFGSTARGEVSA